MPLRGTDLSADFWKILVRSKNANMRGMPIKSSTIASTAGDSASFADLPAPRRERGRLRVAAIMDAAVTVFGEKGYDAATMTEIAARSATAIGSLYRFFPSKEALADALLVRYAQHVAVGLGELEGRVAHLSMEGLAAALVDFMLALQTQRRFAVALVDARGGSDERRARFRATIRGGVARILQQARYRPFVARTRPVANQRVQCIFILLACRMHREARVGREVG